MLFSLLFRAEKVYIESDQATGFNNSSGVVIEVDEDADAFYVLKESTKTRSGYQEPTRVEIHLQKLPK